MRAGRPLATLAGALALANAGACMQVLDINDDRVPRPDTLQERWSCLQPGAVEMATGSRPLQVLAVDLLKAGSALTVFDIPPINNATVRACKSGNVAECDVLSTEAVDTTDDNGQANVRLGGLFDGYIEVTPPEAFNPRLNFDDRLRTGTGFGSTGQESGYLFAYIFDRMIWSTAAQMIFGTPQDPKRAFVYIEVYDCPGNFANGVSFSLNQNNDPNIQGFYTTAGEGIPNKSLTQTEGGRGGGFFNVPAGDYVVTVKDNATGFTTTRNFSVREGWDTTVYIGPYRALTPAP
jgi:hypothetical protein